VHDAGARRSFTFLSRMWVPLGVAANLRFIPRLRRIIREINPDVLHGHFLTGYAFYAACLNFHPFVVSVWGSDLYVHARRSAALRAIGRYTLSRADAIHALAETAREELASRFAVPLEKFHTLRWGIELEPFLSPREADIGLAVAEWRIPDGAKVVICNRSLRPLFRQTLIVEAFAELARRDPEVHLVLHSGYGTEPDYLARLRALSSALDLEQRVTFVLRMLDKNGVAALLRRSSVYVCIPTSDLHAASVLEAAAAGCQIVGSDIPSYREYARDGIAVQLVSGDERRALAEAIAVAVYKDKQGRDREAAENLAFVRARADWRVQAPKMEGIYAAAIASHTGRSPTDVSGRDSE